MTDAAPPTVPDSTAVDVVLAGLMGSFETAFAGRIRSCYIEGSVADGTQVTTSDIDLIIVFKDQFASEAEREQATRLAEHCAAVSSLELDSILTDDAALAGGVSPALKHGSRCVYGEDRRDALRVLPIEEWARQRMHVAYWLLVDVFHRPHVVRPPIDYPDPAGAWCGYTARTVRGPAGAQVPSTRDLIRVTGWIATALVAWQAGVYVARKSACHHAYRQHIGDEWAPFLEDIYRLCRMEWGYLLPTGEPERRALRDLCARTLRFENHFVRLYGDFLVAELRTGDVAAQRPALWVLEQIPYCDDRVRLAVQTIAESDDPDLRQAAKRSRILLEHS